MIPLLVLPNIQVRSPIKSRSATLLSAADSSLICELENTPTLKRFLGNFRNVAGRRVVPSVFAPNEDGHPLRSAVAIASFRDAVALAVVPLHRASLIEQPNSAQLAWSDYFSIYPWMIDKNDQYVIGTTPALFGLELADEFRPQTAPEVSPQTLDLADIDRPMLDALLNRWEDYYAEGRDSWENRALFRSLNMAFRAAQAPAGRDMTVYDIGRSIALWVSAFEILSHPGGTKATDYSRVCALIDRAPWRRSASIAKNHQGRGKSPKLVTNGTWLYGELYRIRNDFLHGNPVNHAKLQFAASGRNVHGFAAPLFRMCLAAFLPLQEPKWRIEQLSGKEQRDEIARQLRFVMPQETIEAALLSAHTPEPP